MRLAGTQGSAELEPLALQSHSRSKDLHITVLCAHLPRILRHVVNYGDVHASGPQRRLYRPLAWTSP